MADATVSATRTGRLHLGGGTLDVYNMWVNAGDYAADGILVTLSDVCEDPSVPPVAGILTSRNGFLLEFVPNADGIDAGKMIVRVATTTGVAPVPLDQHAVVAAVADLIGDIITGYFFYESVQR